MDDTATLLVAENTTKTSAMSSQWTSMLSTVADLRGPVAGWSATPHPTITYLSSSLSQLTDASGALYLVQIVKKHIGASNTFSSCSCTTDATASFAQVLTLIPCLFWNFKVLRSYTIASMTRVPSISLLIEGPLTGRLLIVLGVRCFCVFLARFDFEFLYLSSIDQKIIDIASIRTYAL